MMAKTPVTVYGAAVIGAAVILSAAKDLVSRDAHEILRCAQDDRDVSGV